jgi:hypothetical protein
MALSKITNLSITDDAVRTVGIQDNNVTLAKLGDGTQGDILYYGASGAPTRLGFGTSGDFLKTQGTGANPAWATVTDNGKIGQVSAMAHTYTQTAFTTTTLTDWSGMTCALTPTATSSKIIIMGAAHIYSSVLDNVNISLLRDDGGGFDVLIALADYIGLEPYGSDLLPICFVDSPSVTVEVSYKLQYRSDTGGSCYVNVNDGSNSPTHVEGSNSYIYCMEVLA